MNVKRIQNVLRLGALTAALTLAGAAVQAQGYGPMMGGKAGGPPAMGAPQGHGGAGLFGGGHLEHMLDWVSATDAQRTQIDAIMKAARDELKPQREAAGKLHAQMLALYGATNVDAAAVEALRVQISQQHDAASKRMSQASIEAARVLTPEQRAKLVEILQKRMARMAARHA